MHGCCGSTAAGASSSLRPTLAAGSGRRSGRGCRCAPEARPPPVDTGKGGRPAATVAVPRGGGHAGGSRVGYVRSHPRHGDETRSPSDRLGCTGRGGPGAKDGAFVIAATDARRVNGARQPRINSVHRIQRCSWARTHASGIFEKSEEKMTAHSVVFNLS